MKKITLLLPFLVFFGNILNAQQLPTDYLETVQLELPVTSITGDYIFFKGYVSSNSNIKGQVASGVLYVDLVDETNKSVKKQYHAIVNGIVNGSIRLDKKTVSGLYKIKAYTQWMLNFDHIEKGMAEVCIKCDDKNNVVEEQPIITVEGGAIINEIPSRIVIKHPTLDKGTIVDESGTYVTAVSNLKSGYGAALFTPKYSKSYFFKAVSGIQYELPQVAKDGYLITLNNLDSEALLLRITTSQAALSNDIRLIAYAKNLPFLEKKINFDSKNILTIEIPKDELPKGLIEFYLVDHDGKIQSYRPVAIREGSLNMSTEIVAITDSNTKLKIKVIGNEGAMAGLPVSLAGLKEPINDYEVPSAQLDRRKALFINDLNDLTLNDQKPTSSLRNPLRNSNNFPVQQGLSLAGTAYDLNNKILREEKIEVLASSEDGILIEEVQTNDQGIITMDGMKLLGSNEIVFRKEGDDVATRLVKVIPLGVEEIKRKEVIASTPIELIKKQEKLSQEASPFKFDEGVELKEVNVSDKRKLPKKIKPSTYGVEAAGSRTSYQDPERLKTIPQLFQNIPGVIVTNASDINPTIRIPSARGGVLFVIDGLPVFQGSPIFSPQEGAIGLVASSESSLRNIMDLVNASDVERIEVLLGVDAAIYGSRGAGGVIQVYTRNGSANTNYVARKEASLNFQGYEPEVTFDQYWSDLSRSERKNTNLLYWNSNVILDENGEAIVDIPHYNNQGPKCIKLTTISKDGVQQIQQKNIIE